MRNHSWILTLIDEMDFHRWRCEICESIFWTDGNYPEDAIVKGYDEGDCDLELTKLIHKS